MRWRSRGRIITDRDEVDKDGVPAGKKRAQRILDQVRLTGSPDDHGIFVGNSTFEYDLVNADASNIQGCFNTLRELGSARVQEKVDTWNGAVPAYEDFMKAIDNIGGKGRFAQRLALTALQPPAYVAAALDYLMR